jgi:hypothetical protein
MNTGITMNLGITLGRLEHQLTEIQQRIIEIRKRFPNKSANSFYYFSLDPETTTEAYFYKKVSLAYKYYGLLSESKREYLSMITGLAIRYIEFRDSLFPIGFQPEFKEIFGMTILGMSLGRESAAQEQKEGSEVREEA